MLRRVGNKCAKELTRKRNAALIEAYLAPMQHAGYDPFKTVEVAQWRRQWILWRATRRAL
jgi:hypothetical protein